MLGIWEYFWPPNWGPVTEIPVISVKLVAVRNQLSGICTVDNQFSVGAIKVKNQLSINGVVVETGGQIA
jgi:hypothetical protein